MAEQILAGLALALLSGGISGLIAWGGLRAELRYMRRDLDMLITRAENLETKHNQEVMQIWQKIAEIG